MLQGQEEEQKRIAQDLHDELGGLLASAQLQIKKIQNEIEKLNELKLFAEAELLIDNACKEVRHMAYDIIPSSLTDLGLNSAIENISRNLENASKLEVTLELPIDEPVLTDLQMVNIYRILQEIISNVAKYARAKSLFIKLEQTASQLYIFVTDDGIGFDPLIEKNRHGLGIKGIRSRVKYLNGSMELITLYGHGTTYNIQIPSNEQ